MLSILLAAGSRLLVRMCCEEFLLDYQDKNNTDTRIAIILGAGNSGHLFIKTVLSHKRLSYRPLLVLDDDERLQGFRVHNVKVEGRLPDLASKLREHPEVSAIIVAIPTISPTRLHEIETIAKAFEVPVKRLQSFENIALEGTFTHDGITSVETILDRQVTESHEAEIREQIRGKRILVTGAGGSIGSEIVRQILRFEPSRVILFDSSEYNLFRTDLEFTPIFKNVQKRFVIGSITDTKRLGQIFAEERPQIVFHAAAYKHVPMMEYNCSQAFLNNVIGTWNVLEASSKISVERFVLISTDKAIDPSSVMGCSKRLTEILVQQFSNGLGKSTNPTGDSLNTSVVRFGNVINSTGSVVPLFREQILSGGPVTVTHPDIERYFMSIQEAVHLVLTAGTLGERGEVYVLDMGQRIKIVEVARKMLSLYGRPDIPIVFSGLRPGEKLTEELIGQNENLRPTTFTKVSRLDCPPVHFDIAGVVKALEAEVNVLTDFEIGQRMHKLVAEFVAAQALVADKKALTA